jgi:hypothetical protein
MITAYVLGLLSGIALVFAFGELLARLERVRRRPNRHSSLETI